MRDDTDDTAERASLDRHEKGATAIPVTSPPPIVWMAVLETGVPAIDAEHRYFLDQYKILIRMVAQRAGRTAVQVAAQTLVEQIVRHFANEESVLLGLRFPRYQKHVRAHRAFARQFEALMARLALADEARLEHLNLVTELGDLLIDLLFRHDLDYKSHLLNAVGR